MSHFLISPERPPHPVGAITEKALEQAATAFVRTSKAEQSWCCGATPELVSSHEYLSSQGAVSLGWHGYRGVFYKTVKRLPHFQRWQGQPRLSQTSVWIQLYTSSRCHCSFVVKTIKQMFNSCQATATCLCNSNCLKNPKMLIWPLHLYWKRPWHAQECLVLTCLSASNMHYHLPLE